MEKEEFIDDINCGTRVDAKVRAPSICFKKLSLVSWPARTLIFLKKPPSTCRWMLVWDFFLKLHHLLEFFILCCFCKKKSTTTSSAPSYASPCTVYHHSPSAMAHAPAPTPALWPSPPRSYAPRRPQVSSASRSTTPPRYTLRSNDPHFPKHERYMAPHWQFLYSKVCTERLTSSEADGRGPPSRRPLLWPSSMVPVLAAGACAMSFSRRHVNKSEPHGAGLHLNSLTIFVACFCYTNIPFISIMAK
jgi:hypothetical protein